MNYKELSDFESLDIDVQEILHEKLDEALDYNIKNLINRKYGSHEPTIKVVMNVNYIDQSAVSLIF